MSKLQPETQRMLGIMLREMEQTIMPDLASSRARTVAYQIGQGLRNLLMREEAGAASVAEWNQRIHSLITEAGPCLPEGSAHVTDIDHMARRLEALVRERVANTRDLTDDLCREAIKAERDFFAACAQRTQTVQLPQRTAARRELRDMTPQRLTEYFSRKLPRHKSLRVTGISPILSGFSKETFLVDIEADGMPMPVVIRRDNPNSAVDSTVVDEYPLVVALHRYGLPVPEPVLLETDVAEFGEAFTVTRRAPGTAATNAMAGLVAGAEMRVAANQLAAFLARLHRAGLNEIGLPAGFYDAALSTQGYLLREIDICERYHRNHRQMPSPAIVPPRRTAISSGARKVLFHAFRFENRGVFDTLPGYGQYERPPRDNLYVCGTALLRFLYRQARRQLAGWLRPDVAT